MKSNYLFLSLALSALLFAGCNKQEVAPQGDGTIAVNITATMEDLTKTSISYDSDLHQYVPSWVTGDMLSVFTASTGTTTTVDANKVFTVGTITDGVAANFSGTIDNPGKDVIYDFFAAYPITTVGNDNLSSYKVILPSTQKPTSTSFDPDADILAGVPVKGVEINNGVTSKDIQFSFIRKTAVLKVTPSYNGSSIANVGSDAKISSMTIDFGGTNNITGRVRWNLSTPEADLEVYYDNKTSVTATYPSNEPALNGGNVYMSIAPVSLTSASITVSIITDGGYILSKTFSGMTSGSSYFKAGTVTPITFTVDGTWSSTRPVKKNISEIRDLGDKYSFTEDWYIEGAVLNSEKASTNKDGKCLVIQDGTGKKSGITLYMANPVNNTFSQGDVVRCNLKNTSISHYNGLIQIKLVTDSEVEKISQATLPPVTAITPDQIPDYQSMYVSIAGAQKSDGVAATISTADNVSYNMETIDNSFIMFIPKSNLGLDGKNFPAGNGVIKGIAWVYSTDNQIIPLSESDFSNLTGTRIVTFGDAAISGTMKAGVALSGCSISVPVNNLSANTDYKVSITPSGAGSAGINSITDQVITATTTDKKITASVTGTPTTVGDVLFTVVIKDATGANTLVTKTVTAAVASADTKYFVKVTSDLSDWSGSFLIVADTDKALTSSVASNWASFSTVTFTDGKIANNSDVSSSICTFEKSGTSYKIKLADGKYISNASVGKMASGTSPVLLSISYSASGVTIGLYDSGAFTTWLRKNGTYGFRFYASDKTTGNLPVLYKLED